MVYAAFGQSWTCEVIFEYGGGLRDDAGRATATAIKRLGNTFVEEQGRQVVESLKRGEFSRALTLSEFLPDTGKLGFLKRSADILQNWDGFHYEQARTSLRQCALQCRDIGGDARYAALAGTITRLNDACGRICSTLKLLRQGKKMNTDKWREDGFEGHFYLLGDVITSARRRVDHNPVDCVLRCYRAVEVATQISELNSGINPWRPDWSKVPETKRAAYLRKLQPQGMPHEISLWNGIELVGLQTTPFNEQFNKDLRAVMESRNLSYLEHGYNKVSSTSAQEMLAKTEGLVTAVISRVAGASNPLKYADELRLES
jgi:hypothetical protein